MKKYETVIGLEIHVQLNTNSKAFCADKNAFGIAANKNISPVSVGHPGTLPKLNISQVKGAIKLGLAMGCNINQVNNFDRKHYFYADLPKGYQTSQDRTPICEGGGLVISKEGITRRINLTRIHMEEDAGKSIHDRSDTHSYIDLNRAGVPLLEVVTNPEIKSGEEAGLFLEEMRKLVRFLGISDGNMEQGSLRCDCNISLMEYGASEFGNRVEVKNINSMRNVRRAVEFEYKRQSRLLDEGEVILQETRSFDADNGITFALREKEEAHDYRYFPDPDLPPVIISNEWLANIEKEQPELPWELLARLTNDFKLPHYQAGELAEDPEFSLWFEQLNGFVNQPKTSANWLLNDVKAYLNEEKLQLNDYPLNPKQLSSVILLVEDGVINLQSARKVLLPKLITNPETDVSILAKTLNLIQDTDQNTIEDLIDEVMKEFPKQVVAFQNGKKALLGMFMGQIMRKSGGKVDPKKANEVLLKKLLSA